MKVGIIGAGNMGEAIIRGLEQKKGASVFVYEKDSRRLAKICRSYHVKKITLEQLKKTCNIIIICVKPQNIDEVLTVLSLALNSRQLVISIAAGVTIKHIQKFFKEKVPVVRVMPNMPGLIGVGISAYCLGKHAKQKHAKITDSIFLTMGETLRTTESKMNAVTAVSGSGPGFIAYLADSLISAARSVGLTEKEAYFLSLYTLQGTASLMVETQILPEVLVKRVASKGGTTEAGLKVFNKEKTKTIVKKAIQAAVKRAKELSKE
ncbi:MAG: pyrroline-5-carboxylate reductase [PVC group bacterium]|nr:pyrroline-5-carboxylate reductase [PVC group bacterium]